jgi:hypothetical protein
LDGNKAHEVTQTVVGYFNGAWTTDRRRAPNTSPVTRARARARETAGNQRPWPADKVERWPVDRLIPYAKNARTHSDAQIAAIAASIKEWGWTTPALVGEDGGLIAGHARILAARQPGIARPPIGFVLPDLVRVVVAIDPAVNSGEDADAGWSEAQKRAYVLADNQLAITGSGWAPTLPPSRVRAHARERPPEIKDRGRPTRSSGMVRATNFKSFSLSHEPAKSSRLL